MTNNEPTQPDPIDEAIARNIRMHRAALQLTVRQVAERSGMSAASYTRIEQGQRPVRVAQLVQIGKVLDVSVERLLAGVI